MTVFADLMASMNDAALTLLSDKEAVRLSGTGGLTVGDPFPVIFNDRPAEVFGMASGSRLSIQCAEQLPAGTVLRIDGAEYVTTPATEDRGLWLIELEIAE